ncbi:MAG: Pole remodelling regulatory diguanylate cyclase [bacterium]|nr:Pole remodelling regulatory diguanylate cyclase [bacterium]
MARILIVDDEALNRELLHAYLEPGEHTLVDAESGQEALAAVARDRPDLVLLDVMMPGLSGFDTVTQIKAATRDQFLPVVLVTALADHDSRLRGLRAGADEFLTKPVDRHELLLRVANLLSLRAKEAALTAHNVELVELQRFRDEMSAMIVHDLKNPLSVMLANIDYLIEGAGADLDSLDALHDSKSAGRRAVRLLGNLLDLSNLEAGRWKLRRELTEVATLIEPLVGQRAHMAGARDIHIGCDIDRQARVFADVELMSRVVDNVLDNAFRHTPAGGRIEVSGATTERAVRLSIGNSGAPIPDDARERIFDKFGQAGPNVGRMNLGLGLYFCRLATEAHGGRIWVEQTAELPTVFGLELPV